MWARKTWAEVAAQPLPPPKHDPLLEPPPSPPRDGSLRVVISTRTYSEAPKSFRADYDRWMREGWAEVSEAELWSPHQPDALVYEAVPEEAAHALD